MLRHALALALAIPAATIHAQLPTGDVILRNGRIYTVDETRPFVDAMVVKDGRVVYTGPERIARNYAGPNTRTVDLDGKTVIPGMIDAHAHLGGLGRTLSIVDLTGTKSYDEVIARVVARARQTPAGTWVTGRGWDQNDWADTRFPTHDALSRATPDHPVYLTRVDGHAALVNTLAMKAGNVGPASKDTPGGRFERNADGTLTGVLVDDAMASVGRTIPGPTPAQIQTATRSAIAEVNKWGITSVHDAGVSTAEIAIYERMAASGDYPLRHYIMIQPDDASLNTFLPKGPQEGVHGQRLWIRSIKAYADGALGSRGAALLEPYSDDPSTNGLLRVTPERLTEVASRALKSGFQLNTHAIGDRANRMVLDAYEKALGANPVGDHRLRIEHAQIIHSEDLPRFAQLGVIPAMQSSHQTSDMYWAGNRLGQGRLLGSYAWRSLLNSGVVVANGSDFPVEMVNPLISFHSAFSRQDAANWPVGGWLPQEGMTRDEALKSMTIWAAYAGHMEKDVGSLAPGKLADFVVLDQDIMRIPAELVLKTRVLSTWVGGKPVYERSGAM